MPENDDPNMQIQTRSRAGENYQKIDSSSLNMEEMQEVVRLGKSFAYQLHEGEKVTIVEHHNTLGDISHEVTAHEGDWFEVDLPEEFQGKDLDQLIREGDQHIFSDAAFKLLFHEVEAPQNADEEDDIKKRGSIYEYIGEPEKAAHLPYNAVIETPEGETIWLRKGDVLVQNPTLDAELGTISLRRMSGASGRKSGQFEELYRKEEHEKSLAKMHRHLIGADRSPIAGIQFNNRDLERAHERIGRGDSRGK